MRKVGVFRACKDSDVPLKSKNMKLSEFLSENFHFWVVKFSIYLNMRVFVMSYAKKYSFKNDHADSVGR